MNKEYLLLLLFASNVLGAGAQLSSEKIYPHKTYIYHNGWIDFNKNGRKDIYEDPTQSIEVRVKDLIGQMTVEEKSCQLATFYGYRKCLADSLPTAEWKNMIFKDLLYQISAI